jgi:Neurotransmitter-gated ion-channel ligand binding domain
MSAVFLQATWQDPRLAFDPNAVGDKVVRYTPEQIWEPALTIFNSESAPKRGTVQLTAKPDGNGVQVSLDILLSFYPLSSYSNDIFLLR